MADKYMQWVESTAGDRPEYAAQLAELGELYSKKLWHQLTSRLEVALEDPSFAGDSFLIDLYHNFIAGFAHKINLLKLAFFAVAASKQMPSPADGMAFLGDVITGLEAAKQPGSAEPVLYLKMQIAQYQLLTGADAAACEAARAGATALEALPEPDPQVSASVHYVAMQYAKAHQEYAAFYRSALQYLAYVDQNALPADFRLALAVDVSLAALLGEDVYNFGELLLHPILDALATSAAHAWLKDLLECFHAGDIARYDALCAQHATVLNAQPALVSHERRLREKVTVMSLMELVNELPPEERRVPLAAIAERTRLPPDGVEFLLMKALALHLIEGSIDQVDGAVEVGWVAPRVLTPPQMEALRGRLDAWADKVGAATVTLEAEAAGVVDAV
jgi:26S proteasome regulatory subunit N9